MKTIQELEEALLVKQLTFPLLRSAGTVDSASIDTRDFDTVLFTLQSGTSLATSTLDVKVQESDDDSTFTDITGAAFTQVTDGNHQTTFIGRIKCKNFKQFLRTREVLATANATYGTTATLAKFDGKAPVTQDETVAFKLDFIVDGGTQGSLST